MSLPETFTSSVMLLQVGLLQFLKNSLEFFCMKYSFSCVAYFATLAKLFMLSSDVLLYLIFAKFDTLRFFQYSVFKVQTVETFWASIPNDFSFGMGLSGLEPPTSRLSGVRSNRLSYKPIY